MTPLSAEQVTTYQRIDSNFLISKPIQAPEYHKLIILSLVKEFREGKSIEIPGIKKNIEGYLGNFYPRDIQSEITIQSKGSENNPLIPVLCITRRLVEEGKTVAFYGTCLTGQSEIKNSQNTMSLFYFSNCGCGEVRLATSFSPFQNTTKQNPERRKKELISSFRNLKLLEHFLGNTSTMFLSGEVRKHKWYLGQRFDGLTPKNAIQDYEEKYGRTLTDLIKHKENQILENVH